MIRSGVRVSLGVSTAWVCCAQTGLNDKHVQSHICAPQLLQVYGFEQVQKKVEVILSLAVCRRVKHEPLRCSHRLVVWTAAA